MAPAAFGSAPDFSAAPDAAMAMIGAYDAAIKALDGQAYDPGKYRRRR